MTAGAASLRLAGVTVAFGALTALGDLHLDVGAGTIHAVIGPNGAGKSTLFNVISGIYPVRAGSAHLDETSLVGLRPHTIARLGVGRAFQNVAARGGETVRESLLAGRHALMRSGAIATMVGWPTARREERRHRERVESIAAFTGILPDLDRPLETLPYGRKKIADVTRAICMEPRLLLLDEPAAGLDTTETAEMATLIRDVRDRWEVTVLVIEHDMDLVMSISDQVTVLDFGRRISTGRPDQVRADPLVAEAYLGTGDDTAAVVS
ncbi:MULTISPECIES: ABC transporter ATP-binding protein [unclassified Microbacterium]|uniref:ABC transporter ATP-binding protein n=1 Tax=unclassified Microbacterium TaxID=2609290 RepID=UPI0030163D86